MTIPWHRTLNGRILTAYTRSHSLNLGLSLHYTCTVGSVPKIRIPILWKTLRRTQRISALGLAHLRRSGDVYHLAFNI